MIKMESYIYQTPKFLAVGGGAGVMTTPHKVETRDDKPHSSTKDTTSTLRSISESINTKSTNQGHSPNYGNFDSKGLDGMMQQYNLILLLS